MKGRRARSDTLGPALVSPEKPVHTLRIDEVLCQRYALQERLGEGGMGAVYLAHDRELDRSVAVKVLSQAWVHDAEIVERFEREARLTAKLDHPNIVPVYDVGRHQGRPFMVMKKLEGSTLAALLHEKGGFSFAETLKLLAPLAAAVDFIHTQGFIHRDIKTTNIFVSPDGQPTLLDFGILRASDQKETLTQTGVVIGTPHYMAPEQALGLKHIDFKVDLYAFAVVVFECLTGTLPFDADSELQLIHLQAHAPPPDVTQRAPWLKQPVSEVMQRALAKRPEDRFSNATQLLDALGQTQPSNEIVPRSSPPAPGRAENPPTAPSWRARSTPVASAPVPTAEVVQPDAATQKTTSRRPILVGAALLASLFAVVVFFLLEKEPAEQPNVSAAAPSPRKPKPEPTPTPVEPPTISEKSPPPVVPTETRLVKKDPPPLTKPGHINVVSMHQGEPYWCVVYVDGLERGRTPLSFDSPPGKYQLRCERHGFQPEERQIVVASGQQMVERFELNP